MLAVAVHDVRAATFEHVRATRAWLLDRGVERATLLVVPAADGSPLAGEHVDWLHERIAAGDAIAQHGFGHRQHGASRWPRRRHGATVGLPRFDWRRTAALVDAGRGSLEQAGLVVHGFIAPAYAYTAALRAILAGRFDWWAGLLAVHVPPPSAHAPIAVLLPAHGLATATPIKRRLSQLHLRASARFAGRALRLDVQPADLDQPRARGRARGGPPARQRPPPRHLRRPRHPAPGERPVSRGRSPRPGRHGTLIALLIVLVAAAVVV